MQYFLWVWKRLTQTMDEGTNSLKQNIFVFVFDNWTCVTLLSWKHYKKVILYKDCHVLKVDYISTRCNKKKVSPFNSSRLHSLNPFKMDKKFFTICCLKIYKLYECFAACCYFSYKMTNRVLSFRFVNWALRPCNSKKSTFFSVFSSLVTQSKKGCHL